MKFFQNADFSGIVNKFSFCQKFFNLDLLFRDFYLKKKIENEYERYGRRSSKPHGNQSKSRII